MYCSKCQSTNTIKKGVRNNVQKWYCKACKRYFQEEYKNVICTPAHDALIVKLNNEGLGISSIGRIVGISKSNVVSRIKKLSNKISLNFKQECNEEYEVDELQTFVGKSNNLCYVIYAINKSSGKIAALTTGRRTKENISKVIAPIKLMNPKQIYTDKYMVYPLVIEPNLHTNKQRKINRIERHNLTLRTRLKRLSRKTICYSKSEAMLLNCLKLYFNNQLTGN